MELYDLTEELIITIFLGLLMIWLFGRFAVRDSKGWNKSYETKKHKIVRYVLTGLAGLYSLISLIVILCNLYDMLDFQIMSFSIGCMNSAALLFYGLHFRQSPRSTWVKVRKIVAYTLVILWYINFCYTSLDQIIVNISIPGYSAPLGVVLLTNLIIYGVIALIIWLLLKSYKRDKYIPYKDSLSTDDIITDMSESVTKDNQNPKADASFNPNPIHETPTKDKEAPSQTNEMDNTNINTIQKIGRAMQTFMKKTWKWVVGIIILFILVCIVVSLVLYITDEVIPEQKLDKAEAEIISKFKAEETRAEYAYMIIDRKTDWEYTDVSIDRLRDRLDEYKDEAFHWIENRAFQGDADCQYKLGLIYYNKAEDYVYKDSPGYRSAKEKAAYWWLESANNGYVKAYGRIGISYVNGFGVKQDFEKALYWLKKGAEAGDDYAQCKYGKMYSNNILPKDIERARYWWKLSAAQGNEEAKDLLQKIYE